MGKNSLVKNIREFCEVDYCMPVRKYYASLGSTEAGEATHIVCQYIENHIMEDKK